MHPIDVAIAKNYAKILLKEHSYHIDKNSGIDKNLGTLDGRVITPLSDDKIRQNMVSLDDHVLKLDDPDFDLIIYKNRLKL